MAVGNEQGLIAHDPVTGLPVVDEEEEQQFAEATGTQVPASPAPPDFYAGDPLDTHPDDQPTPEPSAPPPGVVPGGLPDEQMVPQQTPLQTAPGTDPASAVRAGLPGHVPTQEQIDAYRRREQYAAEDQRSADRAKVVGATMQNIFHGLPGAGDIFGGAYGVYDKAITDNYRAQMELVEANAKAGAEFDVEHGRQVEEQRAFADEVRKRGEQVRDMMMSKMGEVARIGQAIENFEFDPQRVWKNTGAFTASLVGIGAAFHGILAARQGRSGADNPVLRQINQTIQRDIQSQRMESEKLFKQKAGLRADITTLGMIQQRDEASLKAEQYFRLAAYNAKLKQIASGLIAPEAKAKAFGIIEQNAHNMAQLMKGMVDSGSTWMRGYLSLLNKKGRGGGAGGATPATQLPRHQQVANPDPFDSIAPNPETGDFNWNASRSPTERKSYLERSQARKNMIDGLNQFAADVGEFRSNSALDRTRFAERAKVRARQLHGRLINLARLKTNSGAALSKFEMDLIKDEFALQINGWLTGAPGLNKRLGNAIETLKKEHWIDTKAHVHVTMPRGPKGKGDTDWERFNNNVRFVAPKEVGGVDDSSSRGQRTGTQHKIVKRAQKEGVYPVLVALGQEALTQGTQSSAATSPNEARKLYDAVRRAPGATAEQKQNAQNAWEAIGVMAALRDTRFRLKAERKKIRIGPSASDAQQRDVQRNIAALDSRIKQLEQRAAQLRKQGLDFITEGMTK